MAACLTCRGRPGGRSSAGGGSWVAAPPSPGRSRMGRWFSSSSPHTGCWCRGRTGLPGCTPQAPAPESAAGPGGTCAGCTGWSREPVWCRPARTLIAESHTSRTGRSPVPPSDTGSHHPAACKMRLRGGGVQLAKHKTPVCAESCEEGNGGAKPRPIVAPKEHLKVRCILFFLKTIASHFIDDHHASSIQYTGPKED